MIEDDDLSSLEAKMRAKLASMPSKPAEEDASEKAMIAKLFGSRTGAELFMRHEAHKPGASKSGRIDLRRPRTFRPPQVRFKFEHWETEGLLGREWRIERYENGRRVGTFKGDDFQKRDALIIKLQASGATVTPIEVAGIKPRPVQGRARDLPKRPSERLNIMAKIATITHDDVSEFDPDFLEEDDY